MAFVKPFITLLGVLRSIATGSAKDPVGQDLAAALESCLSKINPTATATLNFPSTATLLSADLTITCVGAVVGDTVALSVPAATVANTAYFAFVSAADTVTVRFCNFSGGTLDPAAGSFTVKCIK